MVPSPLPEGQDLAELKRVAEAAKDARHRADVAEAAAAAMAEQRDNALHRVETAERERDEAVRRKEHAEYWYAVRLERIKDVAKRVGVWDEVAAIIANGSGTRHTETGYVYDPPTYAQQLNIATYRAKAAEATITSLQAQLAEARDGLKAAHDVRKALSVGRHVLPPAFEARKLIDGIIADLTVASEVFTSLSQKGKQEGSSRSQPCDAGPHPREDLDAEPSAAAQPERGG